MKNNKTYKNSIGFLALMGFMVSALAVMVLPSIASADSLYRQLQTGMSGSDVSSLQTFLAQDQTLYPQGLVTGYFGFLTKAAVSNFQTRNGISAVGRVGPQTLPVLNLQMLNGMGGVSVGSRAPTISSVAINVNNNSATVNWNTDEIATGVVYYSSSPLTTYERTNSVDISGNSVRSDTMLKDSQSVGIPNLQANTTYYFMIYSTDQSGNVSVTWPSTFHTSN